MATHFGTDGWRGVISDTFTFSSLRQVTQAIADAVASEEWIDSHGQVPSNPQRMVVGFDTRFLSDRYAVEAARVLAANGYRVSLTTADIPTPGLSFAVRAQGLIQRFSPVPEYEAHLRTLIDFDRIAARPQTVVVDSMYGSGRGMVKNLLLGTGCHVTEI